MELKTIAQAAKWLLAVPGRELIDNYGAIISFDKAKDGYFNYTFRDQNKLPTTLKWGAGPWKPFKEKSPVKTFYDIREAAIWLIKNPERKIEDINGGTFTFDNDRFELNKLCFRDAKGNPVQLDAKNGPWSEVDGG